MYNLLIVDDEEIERERLVQFVQWERQDIKIIGTAWNGQDALNKMAENCPDIVLADVKMPVMDGLELLRRCRYEYPEVLFVILSGFGDYEFTSQAMAEGVRYYILKPCGEDEILSVMEKVKAQLEETRRENSRKRQVDSQLLRTIPRAKAQFLRNLLLSRERSELNQLIPEGTYRVLALRKETPFSHTQQLMVQDAFRNVYGQDSIPAATSIDSDVPLLICQDVFQGIERLLRYFRQEWDEAGLFFDQAAVSEKHPLDDLHSAYQETQELFHMGKGLSRDTLLQLSLFKEKENAQHLINLKRLERSQDFGELLYGIRCAFAKMKLSHFTREDNLKACLWAVKALYGAEPACISIPATDWDMMLWFSELLLSYHSVIRQKLDRSPRMREIYLAIYKELMNPEFSLRYLSRECLFMNEDYLSRYFTRNTGVKFSTYLQQRRIRMAEELMRFQPEIRVSQLAVIVGYAPDAQYFSKAFHKIVGMSPKAYQESLQGQRNNE